MRAFIILAAVSLAAQTAAADPYAKPKTSTDASLALALALRPAAVPAVIPQKADKPDADSCCSGLCVCGCNYGKACDCAPDTEKRVVTPEQLRMMRRGGSIFQRGGRLSGG